MAPKKNTKKTSSSSSQSDDHIRAECIQALNTFQSGSHSKALKLIKDSLSVHPNSALLHRAQGCIHFETASLFNDSNTKHTHLKNAEESTKRALSLSPNSISHALYYTGVLYELAANHGVKYYQEVIEECEKALLVENPSDPAKDFLERNASDFKDTSQEVRVAKVREDLNELIKKSKKKLGKEEKKEKMIKEVEEDSTAEHLQEINNKIKDLHRRKKEIELKAMAGRTDFKVPGLSTKLKNMNKVVSNSDTLTRARTYWTNTMSDEDKCGLLKVRVEELKAHFSKNKLAKNVLMEAISYAKENKKWRNWECYFCSETFLDSESSIEHAKNKHIGNLSEELKAVLPELVFDCNKILENGVWKPVDTVAAMKIMESRTHEYSEDEKLYLNKFLLTEMGENQKWPLSDDNERLNIIVRIREMLVLLMRNNCLAHSVALVVKIYAMGALKRCIPLSLLEYYALNHTLLSACFLEVPHLRQVLKFLVCVVDTCTLRFIASDENGCDPDFRTKERIVFSSDLSCLILDKRLLQGELILQYQNAVADDGTAITSAVDECDNVELLADDAFVDWLFTSSTIEEHLEAWTSLKEDSRCQGMAAIQILLMEFFHLQRMCEKKCERLSYKKAVKDVEKFCLEEVKKRQQTSDYNYVAILTERQKELERDADSVMGSSSTELKIIQNILKEAQAGTSIYTKIQQTKLQLTKVICALDTAILLSMAAMKQKEQKLVVVSGYDYRSIMVHLLKSFMQAYMEDLVDRDDIRKSGALLAELALDDKKNTNKGGDNLRKAQGKSKDKKKKKDLRKAKDSKAAGGSEEHFPVHQEDAEQVDSPVAHGRDYSDPKIGVPVSTDELERKLENLEYQRQIENEAKQKQLAKQSKDTGGNIVKNVVKAVTHGEDVVSAKPGEDVGSGEQQQLKHSEPVPLPCSGIQLSSDELEDSQPSEDIGLGEEQQPKHSKPVTFPCSGTQLEDSELAHGEEVGSDEEQQPKDPEPVPLPGKSRGKHTQPDVSNDETDESDEKLNEPGQLDDSELANGKDVGSDEELPNHAEPVPLPGKSWGKLTRADVIKYESGESDEQSGEPEQLEDSELANGEDAVSSKPGKDVGSSEQQKHNHSQLGSVPNRIWWGKLTWADVFNADNINWDEQTGEREQLEDSELVNGEDAVSSKPVEDVGSSVQRQLKQSEPVPLPCSGTQLEDSELAHGEDVGSDEEQQPKDPEPVPLPVKSRGADLLNYESDESDEQLNEPEQLDDSELANGKDVGSDEEQPNHAEPVPLPGKSWDKLTLADVFKYEGGESYEKSSEVEQLENTKPVDGEESFSSKPEEDVGSSVQQQLKQSEPVPLPCSGTQLENSELAHGEDVGSDEGKLDYLWPCSWSRCCLL